MLKKLHCWIHPTGNEGIIDHTSEDRQYQVAGKSSDNYQWPNAAGHSARTIVGVPQCRQAIGSDNTHPADEAIESLVKSLGVEVTRGDENDVLDRYYKAALPTNPNG